MSELVSGSRNSENRFSSLRDGTFLDNLVCVSGKKDWSNLYDNSTIDVFLDKDFFINFWKSLGPDSKLRIWSSFPLEEVCAVRVTELLLLRCVTVCSS